MIKMEKYIVVYNTKNEYVPIRHIIKCVPYETIEEIKNWYYRYYNKLDGDEFTICKNIDEVHDFEQLIKRSK